MQINKQNQVVCPAITPSLLTFYGIDKEIK